MIRVNDVEVTQGHFPDNTIHISPPFALLSKGVGINITWRYESDAELFTLICLRRHYGDRKVSLYLPYIPNARMDRVKRQDDVFTLKYFCEVINSLNFESVTVLDAHSNVALALLDRVVQEDVSFHIDDAIAFWTPDTLFFPDEGAMKRYSEMFPGSPYSFGMKRRDWETGKILSLDIMNPEFVKDKKVMIVDDICSRGGTFFHSAKALKEAGAKEIALYVSHCENTILEGEIFNSGLIDKVFTTPSLVHKPELAEKLNYV